MAEAAKQDAGGGVVEVRETRREEKQAILDLAPDVYYGQDYLPFVFDQWDQDPNITGFGAYVDGRLALHWWTCKDNELPTVSDDDVISKSTMDLRGLLKLFQKSPDAKRLFPNGRVILKWIPYRIGIESNFDDRLFESTLILHNWVPTKNEQRQSEPRQSEASESPVAGDSENKSRGGGGEEDKAREGIQEEEEVRVISFGSWFTRPRQRALSYYVDAYGTDLGLLKRHVEANLLRAYQLAGKLGLSSLIFTLCCDQSFPSGSLADYADSRDLKPSDMPYKEMLLLEKEYEKSE